MAESDRTKMKSRPCHLYCMWLWTDHSPLLSSFRYKRNIISAIQDSYEDWIRFIICKAGSIVPGTYSMFKDEPLLWVKLLTWKHLKGQHEWQPQYVRGLTLGCVNVFRYGLFICWDTPKFCRVRAVWGVHWHRMNVHNAVSTQQYLLPPSFQFFAATSSSAKNHILVLVPPPWDCSENQWVTQGRWERYSGSN